MGRILTTTVLIAVFCCAPLLAGTTITLMLTSSGKTVVQLSPDMTGTVNFSSLPDGVYKAEININGKRFIIEPDVDGDGMQDLVVTSQADAASGRAVSKMPRTIRLLLNDKGRKKTLTQGDWTTMSMKPNQTDAAQSLIAVEIKLDANSFKLKPYYSTAVEEMKF